MNYLRFAVASLFVVSVISSAPVVAAPQSSELNAKAAGCEWVWVCDGSVCDWVLLC